MTIAKREITTLSIGLEGGWRLETDHGGTYHDQAFRAETTGFMFADNGGKKR